MHPLSSIALFLVAATIAPSAFAQEEEPEPARDDAETPAEDIDADAELSADAPAGKGIFGQEKLKLGARLGLGFPVGKINGDTPEGGGVVSEGLSLGDAAGSQLPLWIDVGYMVTPNIMVGLYFQYGIVFVADDSCRSTFDCGGSDIRFGVQGQYHLKPTQKLDPWFGLGIGYEWFNYSFEADVGEGSDQVRGFEFLNFQGGLEVNVARHIQVGPFLSISLAQYSNFSTERNFGGDTQGTGSGSFRETALHSWILIGAKGTYSL